MLQNLKNNAYIYYMLSQNHLNSLITHKFDFDDEELVGLYISLVKTIALKLDAQTVQFFFNRRSNDMPLLVSPLHCRSACRAVVSRVSAWSWDCGCELLRNRVVPADRDHQVLRELRPQRSNSRADDHAAGVQGG